MALPPSTERFPADALTVSAVELRRNFGVWRERAMIRPVIVVRHGKPRLVLSSADRFLATTGQGPDGAVQSARAAIPDHSSEGFVVLDQDLRVLAANHVFEDMAGRHATKMLGEAWGALFPTPVEGLVTGHFRHVLQTGASVRFEMPSALLEGRCHEFSVYPHPGGVAALIVNRTAEQAARHDLEDSRSLAAAAALAPRAGHFKINQRGAVYAASPQFKAITGRDAEAGQPLLFTDCLPPGDRPRMSDALEAALSAGRSGLSRTALLSATGLAIPVDLALAPIWRGAATQAALAFFCLAA